MAERGNMAAIVTGAASGMGRCYCRELAAMGYDVIAVDIKPEGLDSLEKEINGLAGGRLVKLVQNLATPEAAQAVKDAADRAGAQVEVLINNAGMIFTTAICETAPARLDAMMRLHCNTPLLLCRAFVPEMIARGKGYVLNISSICAWMSWPLIGMYGNTKRFVRAYSRSLRIECAGTGVKVTTAIFGAVDTPLFGFSPGMTRALLRLGFMLKPQKAAKKALGAMFRGRRERIIGIGNRLVICIASLLPDPLLAYLAGKFGKLLS